MKKTLLIPLLLAIALTGCSSRPSGPTQTVVVPNPEKRLYTLKDRLHLTNEQMVPVRTILEEAYPKQVELMQRIGTVGEQSSWNDKQETEDLEWSILKKLSAVLSDDQMNEYCKILEEEAEARNSQRGPGAHDGKGPGGSGGPEGQGRPGDSRPSRF